MPDLDIFVDDDGYTCFNDEPVWWCLHAQGWQAFDDRIDSVEPVLTTPRMTIPSNERLAQAKNLVMAGRVREIVQGRRFHYLYQLTGDSNRYLRQNIVEMLTNEKRPLAKCGINALTLALVKAISIETDGKCQAVIDDEINHYLFGTEE